MFAVEPQEGNDTGVGLVDRTLVFIRSHKLWICVYASVCVCVCVCVCVEPFVVECFLYAWMPVLCTRLSTTCLCVCVNIYLCYEGISVSCTCEYACCVLSVSPPRVYTALCVCVLACNSPADPLSFLNQTAHWIPHINLPGTFQWT